MSQDIVDTCFSILRLVTLFRVDEVLAEDFVDSGFCGGDDVALW
jgi:hypothetical protein